MVAQLQNLPAMQPIRNFLEKTKSELQGRINAELKLVEFEMACALLVPDKQRKKTLQAVRETKQELWKKALKKAKGDVKKALIFYGKI